MNPQELIAKVQALEQRIITLESQQLGPSIDPNIAVILDQLIGIPYTTTDPTTTTPAEGYRINYFDGTNIYLQCYINGTWKKIQWT